MNLQTNRSFWIDNLRSFITLLVVAHHASLAYTTFAHFDSTHYINSTHPVVDHSRWIGMDVFENYNDIFFMPLMFLISGIFFYNGLKKKGTARFVLDRAKRLGIPFLVAVTFIIPIAYIPSFYLAHHYFHLNSFVNDYLINEQWPVGPPWFIWLLLAYCCLAAFVPLSFYQKAAGIFSRLSEKPLRFLLVCFLVTAVSLIPISLWIGQYTWTGIGPFDFQLNRVLFYFVFFMLGAIFGTIKWEDILFTRQKLLGKPGYLWIAASFLSYGMIELITFQGFDFTNKHHLSPVVSSFIFLLVFVLTCIATCFAFIAVFRKYGNSENRFWKSLSADAYGIYLVHYIFITWMQFALLNSAMPVILKFVIVFLVSLAPSWGLIYILKRIKFISNLI